MVLTALKWLAILAATLLLGAALVLQTGAWLSQDRELLYSQANFSLPPLGQHGDSELVLIEAGDYQFRARVAGFDGQTGDNARPAIILLHGFPVTSAMWQPLMEPLLAAGYRVLAFDQRGYSPGARPDSIAHYQIEQLVSDVFAIADAAALEQFHLAGHDWGAVVGWGAVLSAPERIRSWTGLSIAHPAAFGEALANDPDQQARSRYFLLFAMPWLPESLFNFNNQAMLRAFYAKMSAQQQREYLSLFAEPGALTAALNWYRAMMSGGGETDGLPLQVSTPTLFIWGNRDEAVARASIEAQAPYLQGPYTEIELDAGHWLVSDEPAAVTSALLDHLEDNP